MHQFKMAFFDQYCDKCEHCAKAEYEDPCNECLMEPMNIDSNAPVKFKREEE